MSKQRFIGELRTAIEASVPIVYVVTHEEARARALIAEAVGGVDRVASWTATRGLDADASLCIAALAIQAPSPAHKRVRVLYDVHPQLAEPHVVRSLRDFALTAKSSGVTMILVS